MNVSDKSIKRTLLATAMTAALGTAGLPEPASARTLQFSFTGWFTMINAGGTGALNNGDASGLGYYGWRTPVTGTMTFDDTTNSGTISMVPFSFFGSGPASATTISFVDADGIGGPNTELLANMGFNWNGTNGIPVSLVMEAKGLLDALGQGMAVGDTVGTSGQTYSCSGLGANIACNLPASDGFLFSNGKSTYTLPIGATPIASTTWNTTDIGLVATGTNPSGTLPFTDDGLGGSPMKAGPFPGFNANFDFDTLTLTNDGTGSITAPADVPTTVPETPPPPRTEAVTLGAPTGVQPAGTAEYCLEGRATCDANGSWIADNGVNTINVSVTQTVNTLVVDWRAGAGVAFDTQTVTVTVNDTTPPSILSTPLDISANVQSVTDQVCFSDPANAAIGQITASDVWDAALTIEYSLDGFTYFPTRNGAGQPDCSSDFPTGVAFGPNNNTVIWRVTDDAGNTTTYNQTVTLNLPTGIVGKACTVDLTTPGFRVTAGDFVMRDPTGAQVGTTDSGVTGIIDTTKLCTDEACSNLAPDIIGATLDAGQPFQGLIWRAEPVTLFGPGTWTFETCPGDNSTQCPTDANGNPLPNPMGMTVKNAVDNNGVPQLGAHMLFKWGNTQDIDVVVVWDVDCGAKQLTTTDPDGDGILGTKMVDGPFVGFNAAFDMSATGVDQNGNPVPLIADGGYVVGIPAYANPTPGGSPLPLNATMLAASDIAASDSVAVDSCVGGCISFSNNNLMTATDANGTYQYAEVAFPLDQPIPFWSVYRKFDPATNTWKAFTVDSRNSVKSAPFDANGLCPEPGSGAYKAADTNSQLADKLQGGDNCIQLTIEDNGPNDTDSAAGTVADPSGVASVPEPALPSPSTEGGSGCSIAATPQSATRHAEWWLLGGLLGWLGWRRRQHGSR